MESFEELKVKKTRECYQSCPFFGSDGKEMNCLHPQRDKNKKVIITLENSIGRVPKDCPWQD